MWLCGHIGAGKRRFAKAPPQRSCAVGLLPRSISKDRVAADGAEVDWLDSHQLHGSHQQYAIPGASATHHGTLLVIQAGPPSAGGGDGGGGGCGPETKQRDTVADTVYPPLSAAAALHNASAAQHNRLAAACALVDRQPAIVTVAAVGIISVSVSIWWHRKRALGRSEPRTRNILRGVVAGEVCCRHCCGDTLSEPSELDGRCFRVCVLDARRCAATPDWRCTRSPTPDRPSAFGVAPRSDVVADSSEPG